MSAATVKGFKVTDAERKTRVGIAAKSLEDLKSKTASKFKLSFPTSLIDFQTADGTLIESDEYFATLDAQQLLIWVKKGERAATDAELLYKTIREVNEEYLTAGEKVHEFFTEKMKNKVYKLAEVLRGIDGEKALLSTRIEHPEWFEGLDTNAKTKEEYMFKRAQDRIRTYYYKTKEELLKSKESPPDKLAYLLDELRDRLKNVKHFGCYFDRNAAAAASTAATGDAQLKSICDRDGLFVCQGRWDRDRCLYNPAHRINPYTSREERIIFQTWNLDHVKERSRSVIPAICYALKSDGERVDIVRQKKTDNSVDVKGIFADLFTLNNLKFVHIVCHDKGAHLSQKAGPYLI